MRILLDECVPIAVKARLEEVGHEVLTIADERLAGALNGDVHGRAVERFELLVTTDRDFRHPEKFAPTEFTGIVLVRVTPMTAERVLEALNRFLQNESLEHAKGRKLVLRATDHTWVEE